MLIFMAGAALPILALLVVIVMRIRENWPVIRSARRARKAELKQRQQEIVDIRGWLDRMTAEL